MSGDHFERIFRVGPSKFFGKCQSLKCFRFSKKIIKRRQNSVGRPFLGSDPTENFRKRSNFEMLFIFTQMHKKLVKKCRETIFEGRCDHFKGPNFSKMANLRCDVITGVYVHWCEYGITAMWLPYSDVSTGGCLFHRVDV